MSWSFTLADACCRWLKKQPSHSRCCEVHEISGEITIIMPQSDLNNKRMTTISDSYYNKTQLTWEKRSFQSDRHMEASEATSVAWNVGVNWNKALADDQVSLMRK